MKAAEDAAWSTAMSNSLTSMFDNIGNIGKERDTNNLALLEIIGKNANYTAEQKALMEKIYPGLFSSTSPSGGSAGKREREKKQNKKK